MLLDFAKGHGTRNDFVVFADPDNLLDLTAEQVTFLCDRRGGVGGDGILRAVRANQVPEWTGVRDVWFMDYRNADGSIAEMCGNGIRVFLRYLEEEGLVTGEHVSVATRAGLRTGRFLADGRIAVTMGPVTRGADVRLTVGGESWPATFRRRRQPPRGRRTRHRRAARCPRSHRCPHLGAGRCVPERCQR